ncbi:MAG TPA: bifunctional oligoribonuclease/PAP phosphatase NrnA [Gemmatimonadales bacterium]|nr:bifunctional oligoribonuclease/PAP phosphatase NrnA [Gemmatimonadales bacterium]
MTVPPTNTISAAAPELAALLVPGRRVCLITHVHPDGDGMGSEVAMVHLLRDIGVEAVIANPTPTPARFGFLLAALPDTDRSSDAVREIRRADLIMVLDISDISRLGHLATAVEQRGVPVVCIDHHTGEVRLPPGPRIVDPGAAATGELIYLLAREMGWTVTREVARAIHVAMVTDTGSFRFSNTTPRTLRVAADLLELGADPEEVYLEVYASAPPGRPRLLAETLQTLVIDEENGIAWMTVPPGALERHGVETDDLDGVVEHARPVRGVTLAILFRHVSGGRIKISFRSVGDVDVAALARRFGGGGHTKAAGAAIPGELEDVQRKVLDHSRAYVAALGTPA